MRRVAGAGFSVLRPRNRGSIAANGSLRRRIPATKQERETLMTNARRTDRKIQDVIAPATAGFNRRAALTAAAGLAIAACYAMPAQAQNKPLSGTFAITTLPPGTSFNATAAGIAKLFNENTGARMRLREVGATLEVYVSRRETDFGLNAGPSSHDAWTGNEIYKGKAMKNLRNVLIGPILYGGLVVQQSSKMRFVADLKGKKMPARFNSMPTFLDDINVLFAGGGLKWSDLREVPVAGIRENNQAFMDGLTDAMNASVGAGIVAQADAKHKGVRFLTLPPGDDVAKRMGDLKKGYYPVMLTKGAFTGIIEDTRVWAKDILINTHDQVPEETVYQFAKLMWEKVRSLDGTHPVITTWTHEGMAAPRNTVPRHPGAIRFLKEIGKWTPANDAHEKELMSMK